MKDFVHFFCVRQRIQNNDNDNNNDPSVIIRNTISSNRADVRDLSVKCFFFLSFLYQ